MRDELIRKYDVPETDIILADKGFGTQEEIDIFKSLAQEHGWHNVVDVSFDTHYKSIGRMFPEYQSLDDPKALNVTHMPVEKIIRTYDDPRVTRVIEALEESTYEEAFRKYEAIKGIIFSIPGAQKVVYLINRRSRTTKDNASGDNNRAAKIDVFKP